MKSEANKRLEQEKHKLYRLENRKSYLESGSRKQRNHRLITRGAAVESVMPDVKLLTEQEFYSLMERISEQPVVNNGSRKQEVEIFYRFIGKID